MNENVASKPKLTISSSAYFGIHWCRRGYTEAQELERQNLSTSPLQSQLSFCRASVMVQMV